MITISAKLASLDAASKAKIAAKADHTAGIAAADTERVQALAVAEAAHEAAVAAVADNTAQAEAAYTAAVEAFWTAATEGDQVLVEGDAVADVTEQLIYVETNGVVVSHPLKGIITPDGPVVPT